MDYSKKIDQIIDNMKDDAISTLQKWIRIKSLKSSPAPGAPFGKTINDMLKIALDDCKRLGFKTRNIDGYAGDAQLGDSPDVIGILAHLDVVPPGEGWSDDPFSGKIKNGAIYGRGTGDDKGPAVAALYAMAAVKESGLPLKKSVRLILGCDEESGMEDMAYYKEHADMPEMGFSPDANYPVINTEKGRMELLLTSPLIKTGLEIISIEGGDRANVIPGSAKALIKGDDKILQAIAKYNEKTSYPVVANKIAENMIELTTIGKVGHAAIPDGGRNANGQLVEVLEYLGALGPIKWLSTYIGMESDGKSLNIAVNDNISGSLTLNLGILKLEEDFLRATLDIRYPVMADSERIISLIRSSAEKEDVEVSVVSNKGPHHVPEDSFLVQSLLNAYNQVTGLPKEALAIGGGTYARWLGTGVAFGSVFPGEPELAHQADEHMTLESFIKNIRVIAQAIINLAMT